MNTIDPKVLDHFRTHPTALASVMWPDVVFYNRQIEIIESVDKNDETFVHAGNMLR